MIRWWHRVINSIIEVKQMAMAVRISEELAGEAKKSAKSSIAP
jgi:hypothetical protein